MKELVAILSMPLLKTNVRQKRDKFMPGTDYDR